MNYIGNEMYFYVLMVRQMMRLRWDRGRHDENSGAPSNVCTVHPVFWCALCTSSNNPSR
jgi:hypothetical protein